MPRPTNSRAGEELPLSNLMFALFSSARGLFALEMMNFHENERSRRQGRSIQQCRRASLLSILHGLYLLSRQNGLQRLRYQGCLSLNINET